MENTFDKDLEKLISLLKDRNVRKDAKIDLVIDFCNEYHYEIITMTQDNETYTIIYKD